MARGKGGISLQRALSHGDCRLDSGVRHLYPRPVDRDFQEALSTLERKFGLVLVSPKETPAPAPEGQRHVAWGVSPRDRSTKPPRSPERATAVPSIRRTAVAPSGLWDFFGPPSWGSRPRLHAVAPSEPGLFDDEVSCPYLCW